MYGVHRQQLAMVVGGAGVIFGTLLPWLRSGGRRRHSYDLLELVERIGFAPDGAAAAALRWWPIVPLLVVAAVVAVFWGRLRVGGSIGVVAALYAGGTALAVQVAPSASTVDALVGTTVTMAAAAVLLAGSAWAIVAGFREPFRWRRRARP